MLDGCIIRAPETVQDKFFFSVLMEAGLVLSGREARLQRSALQAPEEDREEILL